ncbi:FecR domain-containing protein [Rugamonas sp.]|uniref:FecR domain-containing protein n=1 Tax=Rugamonas sp. TaxID=1926287 RepID=UPI0025E94FFF|nr:FecR domain-containing protein [Rugamonas sp.]
MYHLSYLLLTMALLHTVLPARAETTLSDAAQPVRLLRGTNFYSAVRGARLQSGDLLETGDGGVQIDIAGIATLALGPATRVYFKLGAGAPEVQLLDGWLKVQAAGTNADNAPRIASGALAFAVAGGSVTVRHAARKTELFVENGELLVSDAEAGKTARAVKVLREQYAVRNAAELLKLLPRAPRDFLGGMPPTFLDTLVSVNSKGVAVAPKLDAAATFSQVTPWLADAPALRQTLQRRFYPPPPKKPAPPSVAHQ